MTARAILEARFAADLARLRAAGLFRAPGDHPARPFSHNDYLGLRRHPRLIAALRAALDDGLETTSTGSRLLSGNHPLACALEEDFANSTGMGSALVFGSASEANRAAIGALLTRRDVAVHDELAHASLIDGIVQSGATRRRFAHNDPDDLRRVLRANSTAVRLVVVESVYSMEGDIAPLESILAVCEQEDALLLVDETHAVGLFGARCTGLSEALPKTGTLVATVHGFGKALASSGGILCGSLLLCDHIRNTCRAFIFTTAPSPLSLLAAREALAVTRDEPIHRARLAALSRRLAAHLAPTGRLPPRGAPTAILPFRCDGLERATRMAARLSAFGWGVRPIRPPTVPAGTERLRFTVSAELSEETIDRFAADLLACWEEEERASTP